MHDESAAVYAVSRKPTPNGLLAATLSWQNETWKAITRARVTCGKRRMLTDAPPPPPPLSPSPPPPPPLVPAPPPPSRAAGGRLGSCGGGGGPAGLTSMRGLLGSPLPSAIISICGGAIPGGGPCPIPMPMPMPIIPIGPPPNGSGIIPIMPMGGGGAPRGGGPLLAVVPSIMRPPGCVK